MPDLSAAPFLQRALNRKDAMTDVETAFQQELEQLDAELLELQARGKRVKERLAELRSKLDPLVCPCAACATAKKYAAGAS